MDKVSMGKIEELTELLAIASEENAALHQMIQEFRDELTLVKVQLNTTMQDRMYIIA